MRKFVYALIILAIGAFNNANGQFTFSVSPGLNLNSANFGFKVNNKIVPYIGLQLIHAKVTVEENWEELDYYTSQIEKFSDEVDLSGNIFVPNIGVKYFFIEKNKLKSYFNVNLAKPIIMAKIDAEDIDQDEVDEVIDNVKLFGAEFGFGVEYFFDENFSIGGEFGIRMLRAKFKTTYTNYDYYYDNSGNYHEVELEDEISAKLNLSPTFSKISLNFYF